MKKLFFLPLLVLVLGSAGAQTAAPVRLPMTLRAVTLYPGSAELQHRGELALPAGAVEVRLTGLSPQFNGASVQPEVSGAELDGVELLDDVAPAPGSVPGTLTDSLRVAQETVRRLLNEQTANAAERAFLEENRRVSPPATGNWLADVQRGAAYYRTRLAALAQRDIEIAGLLPPRQQAVAGLNQRAGLLPTDTKPQVVVLRLNLPRPATVRVDISYQLPNDGLTGWEPEYELRVRDTALTHLRVVSRARLRNYTGLPWRNVPVSLRTAEPAADVSRPRLDPWAVSFGRGGGQGEGRLDKFAVKAARDPDAATAPAADAPDLGARLQLPAPVTLAAKSARAFRLAEQTLPMHLEYLAVPKRAEQVFLVGKVTDWNQVNFLTETAQVFFRGAYMGETTLDTRAYTDTLVVALGRDPQLPLTRTKREDFESPTNGGSRQRIRLAYEITVKNTHAYPVRLRLLDQVPISQEKEITVKVLETSGAALDAPSGRLTWQFTLAPGATRKLPFSFQVEAPADREINLRHNREVHSLRSR